MNTCPLDFYHQSDNQKNNAKFAKFRLAFPPVEKKRLFDMFLTCFGYAVFKSPLYMKFK